PVEESIDGPGRVRRGHGETPHQPRAEDEGAARASDEEGRAVRRIGAVVLLLLVAGVGTAIAQRRGGGFGGGQRFGGGSGAPILPNLPYDGRFTFIRLRYGPPIPYQTQRVGWSHDYPEGEVHFTKILNELSTLAPHMEQSNVLALDDPELFKHPLSYMCEPGRWVMT